MLKWKFFKIWFPVAFYSGIIFYVSSLPNLKVPFNWAHADKILHFLEYLPFGFFLVQAIRKTKRGSRSSSEILLGAFWGALLYGSSDEFHQLFVIGRSCSLADLMFDVFGSMVGGWLNANYKAV